MTIKKLAKVKEFINPPELVFDSYTQLTLPKKLKKWCLKNNIGMEIGYEWSVMHGKVSTAKEKHKNVYVFAKSDNEYVAWALLSKDRKNQFNIFVLPEFRQKGIGAELIEYILKTKGSSFLLVSPHDKVSHTFFKHINKKNKSLRYTSN